MKIVDFKIGIISIPLKRDFKTALRTVNSIEDIVVKIITDTGNVGYGEAAPTAIITGDTTGSIKCVIENYIMPNIMGMDIENVEEIMLKLNNCIIRNSSAKAAIDIAVFDLFGQLYKSPLYKLLGGYRSKILTDITISVNPSDQMALDSIDAVNLGYQTLKIKVGKDAKIDIDRMKAIRKAVGYGVSLRIDANQGWKPKEAVRTIRRMEDSGIDIELVEQPVEAQDFEGLKYVSENVLIPVAADESVFSPADAVKILHMRAADFINIKLMKTGGIYNALKICALAESFGVGCMIGCMLESKISVTAAAHLAGAKSIITKIDLDGPVLCKKDLIDGGAIFDESTISISNNPGLGFNNIGNVNWNIR